MRVGLWLSRFGVPRRRCSERGGVRPQRAGLRRDWHHEGVRQREAQEAEALLSRVLEAVERGDLAADGPAATAVAH